jgi:hypothetical protein
MHDRPLDLMRLSVRVLTALNAQNFDPVISPKAEDWAGVDARV